MTFNRTIIPDGDNQPRLSRLDGETFVINRGDTTTVDGAPVVTFDDDQVRLLNLGTAATTGTTATVDIQGDRGRIDNFRGQISSEDTGIAVSGTRADIRNTGTIEGNVNGVNFVNGGESSGRVSNEGTISSDSRAVNIGGDGVTLRNFGDILGTGDQRNGTVYTDGTADNYLIANERRGTIDAGNGNNGAGVALQTGDTDGEIVEARLTNRGTINGRGQAAADTGEAGDGIRVFAGADNATFRGEIVNRSVITSESEQGPVSAIRIANGVNFDGNIDNGRAGIISGANNGVYFGTGNHDATINNRGIIESSSRAVNIDGSGVHLVNSGQIRGTDDQRNGTVYSDGTADNYSITNSFRALIDAGEDNQGAGIALQTGDVSGDTVNASITNNGAILGRGQAAPNVGLAGDGIRIFAGADNPTFQGNIVNRGIVSSESDQGAVSAIRIANGVNFDGTIDNRGRIDGDNNGLYFGTGDHNASVTNRGVIQSDSRAVNIDGTGVELTNSGRILGTGDQRNGTVYADSTADDYVINNTSRGIIDAGQGNDGSGVSLQTGDVDGDIVQATVTNSGRIIGRGDAETGNTVGDGLRLFSGQTGVTFEGDITNRGLIQASSISDTAVGISIENGITLDGSIINSGHIRANETAIDATEGGSVTLENSGRIDGDVRLSGLNDTVVDRGGRFNGEVDGGEGIDTLDFSNLRGPVNVDLDINSAGPNGTPSQVGATLTAPPPAGGQPVQEFVDFENVIGTSHNDFLFGNNEANVLDGGAGNDLIHSFGGADTLIGGDGIDTALFTAGGGVTVDLDDAGNGSSSAGDTLIGFENINGSNNEASANGGADVLSGNAGGNVLNGQAGNDTLNGEGGNDTLIGGVGNDTFVFELGTGSDTVTDFAFADDSLDVGAFFADAVAAQNAARQDGNDTIIELNTSGDEVRLVGVDVDDLQSGNFIV